MQVTVSVKGLPVEAKNSLWTQIKGFGKQLQNVDGAWAQLVALREAVAAEIDKAKVDEVIEVTKSADITETVAVDAAPEVAEVAPAKTRGFRTEAAAE